MVFEIYISMMKKDLFYIKFQKNISLIIEITKKSICNCISVSHSILEIPFKTKAEIL